MKRVVAGAILFLIAAAASANVAACDSIPYTKITTIFQRGSSTVIVSADEDFVTVVTYDSSETKSEWM
ncbi:MAG TPA: hypothetical protein VN577_13925 [Terriglobales bacterium]|nr:hypothetical protein [Terriglobales bacterium]